MSQSSYLTPYSRMSVITGDSAVHAQSANSQILSSDTEPNEKSPVQHSLSSCAEAKSPKKTSVHSSPATTVDSASNSDPNSPTPKRRRRLVKSLKNICVGKRSTSTLGMAAASAPSLVNPKILSLSQSDSEPEGLPLRPVDARIHVDTPAVSSESELESESENQETCSSAVSTITSRSYVQDPSGQLKEVSAVNFDSDTLHERHHYSDDDSGVPASLLRIQDPPCPMSPCVSNADAHSISGDSQSTICDATMRAKLHRKQKCKAADGSRKSKRFTKFFRELRDNLGRLPTPQESQSSVSMRGSDGEERLAQPSGISMYDMLEFVGRTLKLVKSWINEVPLCCRQRLCRCDAFISFFCAEFYKQTEILVSEELFAFIFWHVLEHNGSPKEYDLEFLKTIFDHARTEPWAESWRRCPLSNVFDHLSHFLKCQNERTSATPDSPGKLSQATSAVVMAPTTGSHPTLAPKIGSVPVAEVTRQRKASAASSVGSVKKAAAPVTPVASGSSIPDKSQIKKSDVILAPSTSHTLKTPVVASGSTSKKSVVELVKSSDNNRAMSLESLSGALSNTRVVKCPSKLSTVTNSVEIPKGSQSENTVWREDVDKLNASLAVMPSRYPNPQTSKSAVAKNGLDVEVENKCRDRLQSACSVLYKTGRRNLLRMADFSLTEFFMQCPNLTCCLLTTKGPILVHDALFGMKLTNWNSVKKTATKWAGRYMVLDLRKEQIPMMGLWTVIEFVYNGSFTVTAANVFESQKAAEFFGAPVITDVCLRLLNCLTSSKMVCHTVESLRQQQKQSHPLWTLALGKLIVCFDECRNDKIMVKWPLDLIVPILEQPELCTKDEVNVYNFAVRWVEADFPRRKTMVPQIMNTVRFVSMPADTLLFISSHAKILDGHPELRQEIADLHLKVRMESSGFEIPPEMDWSIPRRTRRVPTAAKGYIHSGRDINVLMLYFCPRVPRSNSDSNGTADDLIPILRRYLKVAMKFVFIDEEGHISRHWLYSGPPKPELREIIRLRQKDLKKHQVWNQSASDLSSASATGAEPEVEVNDENADNVSTKTKRSTDFSSRRDPRCLEAIPGTAFENILKYLTVTEPELPMGGRKESVFDATYAGKRLVDSLTLLEQTSHDATEIIKQQTIRKGERDRQPVCSPLTSPKETTAILTAAAEELVRSTKADKVELKLELVKDADKTPSDKATPLSPPVPTMVDDAFAALQDASASSSFFTDWVVPDKEKEQEKEKSEDRSDASGPKKWYFDLAEKMRLFGRGRPSSGDATQIYQTASSISLRSRDLDSPGSSKNPSPNRTAAASGDVIKHDPHKLASKRIDELELTKIKLLVKEQSGDK
ncbi:uncharacterized protein LOC129590454 [Paramacrobiotus metropolitanus]|uniref:uncharacterized protein LOC129590454 n=1 Tax=Paramacrobiotus metropolitanus TaxID=2943436 RepID=UPI0024461785|nr:uncharacterized protein LOC129590454 [Paramacrobiotus metropolitanus]